MDNVFSPEENLGSMVLLTNKTTISNKLLSLANPRPRRPWICRHIKVTVPSIGTVWYLPVCWLFHIYLVMTCIREMNLAQHSDVNSVVPVLLVISTVAIVFFTASSILKVGQPMMDPNSGGWTYQKHPSMKHIVQALGSQKYHLQALAAFILVNSYLLLQHSQLTPVYQDKTLDNDTVQAEWNKLETNSSASELAVLPLPSNKIFPFMVFCVNFAIPLVFYTMEESESVWQKQYLWGFCYSVLLLLSVLKYLFSALTFHVVSLQVHQSLQIFTFQGLTTWLPPLYAVSALSLFLYSFSLKINMEMSFQGPVSGSPASNLTLRRKVRIYPSPLGVIITTLLVIGSEVPFLWHLFHSVVLYRWDIFMVFLLTFNLGFCLLIFCGCLILGLRRRHLAKKCRGKQKQTDRGLCLATSFLYQSGPEMAKKRPDKN